MIESGGLKQAVRIRSSSLKIQQISETDGGVRGRSGRAESPSGRLKEEVSLGSRPVRLHSLSLCNPSLRFFRLSGFCMFSSRKHQMPSIRQQGFCSYGLWANLRCHSHPRHAWYYRLAAYSQLSWRHVGKLNWASSKWRAFWVNILGLVLIFLNRPSGGDLYTHRSVSPFSAMCVMLLST